MNERRRKLVRVSRLLAQDMLWTNGQTIHVKCTKGLPANATFIGMTYDHMRDIYFFCYQSVEWEEVPNYMMLPEFDLEFTNLYVAPFLEQAEALIGRYAALQDDPDCAKWIKEYRAFKKQTGYPEW